ncbi:hypothetical protein NBO_29g0016, partial [Nosema bombycis CQ1]
MSEQDKSNTIDLGTEYIPALKKIKTNEESFVIEENKDNKSKSVENLLPLNPNIQKTENTEPVSNLNVEKKEDDPSQPKVQSSLGKNDKVERPLMKRLIVKPKTTESVNTKENKISSTPVATIADEYIESSSSISEEYVEESEETINASQDIKLHFDDDIVSSEDEDELCFKNKKKPKKWTQEETDALLDGVSKFGRGKWVEISQR